MTPFPWHSFEIRTRLTSQQVREALAAHLEEEKWFRIGWPNQKNDKRFAGRVMDGGFEIHRILGYRNSFAPVSTGTISSDGRGARIEVKMRLHPLVIGFIVVWLAIMLSLFTGAAFDASPLFAAIPILALLFIYTMTLFAFWFEASKQEQTLREIFQAA